MEFMSWPGWADKALGPTRRGLPRVVEGVKA